MNGETVASELSRFLLGMKISLSDSASLRFLRGTQDVLTVSNGIKTGASLFLARMINSSEFGALMMLVNLLKIRNPLEI